MTRRAFIIHGWDGHPDEGWLHSLQKELKYRGFLVQTPAMPKPKKPEIHAWTTALERAIGTPDNETYLIGHSIGCQAIMRYLERTEGKIGGCVFVGGWFMLSGLTSRGAHDRRTVAQNRNQHRTRVQRVPLHHRHLFGQ